MLTKDKDFAGCHPEIREALKAGKHALCRVWDEGHSHSISGTWVVDYKKVRGEYRYITEDEPDGYHNAEPVVTATVVKHFWPLMMQLKEDLYVPVMTSEGLVGFKRSDKRMFAAKMFRCCGKAPEEEFEWEPEWLAEVEV